MREVLDGSPADQVGLAPGDVITGFDGKTVNSDTTLTDLLDQHYPDNVVSVTWLDQGHPGAIQTSSVASVVPILHAG